MAEIATINLSDTQATPANHAFEYASQSNQPGNGMVIYEDRTVDTYIGYNKLTLAVVRPKGDARQASRNLKLMIKLETPKLAAVTGGTSQGLAPAPAVSHRPTLELVVTLPERSSLRDRMDLRKYLMELLGNQVAIDMFSKYQLPN